MFGEDAIFGQTELKIGDKGRICIPANTQREIGEKLVLVHNKNLNLYEIYSIEKLENRFKKLNDLIMNAKTEKDRIFYEKMFYEFSKSILRSECVDTQGRILTGKIFEGYEKVLSTGAYDHLIIEPLKDK